MPASYPGSVKTFTTKVDGTDFVMAAHMNDVQNEITAIETELGTNPKGSYINVAERIGDHSVKAYKSTSKSINHNTWTILDLDAEYFDTDSMHDLTVNNHRITCVHSGKYIIIAAGNFDFSAAGHRALNIKKNASGVSIAYEARMPVTTSPWSTTVQTMVIEDLIAGDYIWIEVFQNSGAPLNFLYGDKYSPIFSAARIA